MDDSYQLIDCQSLAFAEQLYADYAADRASVSTEWRDYFDSLARGNGSAALRTAQLGPSFRSGGLFSPATAHANGNGAANGHGALSNVGAVVLPQNSDSALQGKVDQLARAFRVRGHMIAQLDPLGMRRENLPELTPEFYGLAAADMDKQFSVAPLYKERTFKLSEIIEMLHNTYCRRIGVQYMHIHDYDSKFWLLRRMEESQNRFPITRQEQLRILRRLTEAVVQEEFLDKKYIGLKRFSLEGGESLIPLLQQMLDKAAAQGVKGCVIGMAHRGRLNVLSHIIGMSAREIFREFEGDNPLYKERLGDVKYHLGYSTMYKAAGGQEMYLSLSFNPSHLEYINPVVMGRVRAEQDRFNDTTREHGLAIQIHGDAAFSGEGVCQETLNLSQLQGYTVGGSVHIVINNQLGFTTDPQDGRSMTYSADVAKMLQVPVFHVNGEDPEAVAQVVEVAMDFRQAFQRDVVIDMYCYRKHGHNESDDPSYTQPLMYAAIKQHKNVRESYLDYMLELGGVTRAEADEIASAERDLLETELAAARNGVEIVSKDNSGELWKGYVGGQELLADEVDTGVPEAELRRLLERTIAIPNGFTVHPGHLKSTGLISKRKDMLAGKRTLDWSAGEALAFATLSVGGHRIRMSGQDCERGTFAHRHAVWHDHRNGLKYFPLMNLQPEQARIEIYNSPLSEAAVMGFEFGYSLDSPGSLVIWEAQFGDFCNAAQVIIDQFIASCETKWDYLSGLTLLLPHGFEGMGPEHSSARLERFLLLAANDNIQVCVPSTPAQIFHLLRRQVMRNWRKPLIVLTPKGFLRTAESDWSEFTSGTYQRILPDNSGGKPAAVRKILLCCGKMYYDLNAARIERGGSDTAIIRLEQLYPLRTEMLEEALKPYRAGTPVAWVQEEPENMGAWYYLNRQLGDKIGGKWPLSHVSRPISASPSTGSDKIHKKEQAELVERALETK